MIFTMADDNDIIGELGSVAIGLVGGIALAEILSRAFKKYCTNCRNEVSFDQEYCNYCMHKLK